MKSATFLLTMGAFALTVLATPVFASDSARMVPRAEVSDARPVMLAAIQASDGEAHGILIGDVADAITRRFNGTSPIFIDVTTGRRYQQPGCSRLNVLFRQDGVLLPGTQAPRKQTMEFGINYCLDGMPPKSLL